MSKNIFFKNSVKKDLKQIPADDVKMIFGKIKSVFSSGRSAAIQLHGRYAKCLSLRIGKYRIIYAKINQGILILRIAHRKEVYKT